ncbi:hypothetical protein SCH4B_4730 [Ruegeria sp. TrichCH4B]|nr:hypothetical protein SCH4B_4730 [Ruegeria sp. TrichCH4B]
MRAWSVLHESDAVLPSCNLFTRSKRISNISSVAIVSKDG